jgi:hypothetical protein
MTMAVVTVLEFPDLTREQYEWVGASLAAGAPEGILYHACGAVEDGWRIMDVWESQEAFDRFVDRTYLPAVRQAGGPEPSRREVVAAHHAGVVQRG